MYLLNLKKAVLSASLTLMMAAPALAADQCGDNQVAYTKAINVAANIARTNNPSLTVYFNSAVGTSSITNSADGLNTKIVVTPLSNDGCAQLVDGTCTGVGTATLTIRKADCSVLSINMDFVSMDFPQ